MTPLTQSITGDSVSKISMSSLLSSMTLQFNNKNNCILVFWSNTRNKAFFWVNDISSNFLTSKDGPCFICCLVGVVASLHDLHDRTAEISDISASVFMLLLIYITIFDTSEASCHFAHEYLPVVNLIQKKVFIFLGSNFSNFQMCMWWWSLCWTTRIFKQPSRTLVTRVGESL
jgi:hypothetical protein